MKKIPLFCDSQCAIHIFHNPVQHFMAKHKSLGYHFIKDYVENGNIEVHFVQTTDPIAYIFTKPLYENLFSKF